MRAMRWCREVLGKYRHHRDNNTNKDGDNYTSETYD